MRSSDLRQALELGLASRRDPSQAPAGQGPADPPGQANPGAGTAWDAVPAPSPSGGPPPEFGMASRRRRPRFGWPRSGWSSGRGSGGGRLLRAGTVPTPGVVPAAPLGADPRALTGAAIPAALPAPAPAPLAPAWGWKPAECGRAVHVPAGVEYQATTTQLCGLFPFMAGSGTPTAGTPVGRHMLWGEVVCLDPLAWLRAGLVTNPGVFVLGQPGTGKSALVKRLVTGAVSFGTRVLVLGDTKPDYTPLVEHLGGQVIRVGRGLDRINPLDAGPLGDALRRMTGPAAEQLRQEVRSPAAVTGDGAGHAGARRADHQRGGGRARPRLRPAR